jgi:hypothetical protein
LLYIQIDRNEHHPQIAQFCNEAVQGGLIFDFTSQDGFTLICVGEGETIQPICPCQVKVAFSTRLYCALSWVGPT